MRTGKLFDMATDGSLQQIVDEFNRFVKTDNTNFSFTFYEITDYITYAKLDEVKIREIPQSSTWEIKSTKAPFSTGNYFLFFKGDNQNYVGVVYVMKDSNVTDLHWFTLPKHRNNGYLKRVIDDILCFISCFENQETLYITVRKDKARSYEIAKKFGFLRQHNDVSDENYVLMSKDVECDRKRFDKMRRRKQNILANTVYKKILSQKMKLTILLLIDLVNTDIEHLDNYFLEDCLEVLKDFQIDFRRIEIDNL